MNQKIKRTSLRIAVFAVIASIVLWLIPAGLAFGEGSVDLDALKAEVEEAQANLDSTQAGVDSAEAALADAQAALDSAEAALADAQAAVDVAKAALDAVLTNPEATEQEILDAQAAVDVAQAAFDSAEATLADAKAALDAAQAALDVALNEGGEEGEDPLEEPPIVVEEQLTDPPILNPIISTDKDDYVPEETVVITGTGFAPNTVYTIVVTRPDGSVVTGDGSFTPGSDSVLSDAAGNFTYYVLS